LIQANDSLGPLVETCLQENALDPFTFVRLVSFAGWTGVRIDQELPPIADRVLPG
jgi:hypothetical protein